MDDYMTNKEEEGEDRTREWGVCVVLQKGKRFLELSVADGCGKELVF